MTVLWVEPPRCRWCGEWTYYEKFCSLICESLARQKHWVTRPNLMQVEKENRG